MANNRLFLYLTLFLSIVPFGLAATEDAIREVGYRFTGVLAAGIFSYLVFYISFKLNDDHEILKLLLLFVGMAGMLNMTGMIADQGGKFFSMFQTNIRLLYAVIAYIVVALFYYATKYFKRSMVGGQKDDW